MDNAYCVIGFYEDGESHEDLLSVHRTEDGAKAEVARLLGTKVGDTNHLYDGYKFVSMAVQS